MLCSTTFQCGVVLDVVMYIQIQLNLIKGKEGISSWSCDKIKIFELRVKLWYETACQKMLLFFFLFLFLSFFSFSISIFNKIA